MCVTTDGNLSIRVTNPSNLMHPKPGHPGKIELYMKQSRYQKRRGEERQGKVRRSEARQGNAEEVVHGLARPGQAKQKQ
jgi:hypothetical protein